MRRLLLLTAVWFFAFAAPSLAYAEVRTGAQCENCSQQDMQETAHDVATSVGDEIYVFSLGSGVIRKYIMMRGAGSSLVPRSVSVEQDVANHFADLAVIYSGNGNSLTFSYDVASGTYSGAQGTLPFAQGSRLGKSAVAPYSVNGMPASAYDVLDSPASRSALMQHMQGTFPGFIAGFNSVTNIFNPIVWLNSAATRITVLVEFPDSTSVRVVFDYDTTQWEYVPRSARDGHDNIIPESPIDFAGDGYREFHFPNGMNDHLFNFLNRASLYGIPITGPGGGAGGGVGCTRVGDGPTTCHWIPF